MNAPMVIEQGLPAVVSRNLPMTAEDVRDHVNLVQQVMRGVMKQDVHYGVIPGTDKPTLYKAGAEMLCLAFHIAQSYEVENLSTSDCYRYRVRCIGTHQGTGTKLAEGMGSCSSNEEKYKWRRTNDKAEYEAAPEGRRRMKVYKKKDGNGYSVMQVRAEIDDIDNTVLKMACKRALTAMTLNAVAASDIFAQDIEDLPEHLRTPDEDEIPVRQEVQQPRSTKAPSARPPTDSSPAAAPSGQPQQSAGAAPIPPENDKPLSDGAKAALQRALKAASRTEADVQAQFGVAVETMKFSRFNEVMAWIKQHPAA